MSVRSAGAARSRARAPGALLAGLTLLVAVLGTGLAAALGGCGGGSAPAVSAHPFGTPPVAAPGVHAWAAGEIGTLLVTADGGATWKRQKFFLSERGVDVAFTDVREGWLVTDAGTVLVTSDGGADWHVVSKAHLQVKGLAATDARHAWIVGSAVGVGGGPGSAVVLATADGGGTWARMGFGDAELAGVAFADARHGVLIALDSIWTTSDGGRRWKPRRQVGLTVLTGVCAGDAQHAWVAGWATKDGAPLVFATQNGGVSWRRLTVDVPEQPPGALQTRQIVAAGASRLWITCPAGVLASDDAGSTWTLQKVAAGQPQAIAAADERHLVATTTGQPILATADGGATWPAWGQNGLLGQPLVSVAAVAAPAQQ